MHVYWLILLCILPATSAITLKDYYTHLKTLPQKEEGVALSQHEQPPQFRPPPKLLRPTTDIQNDVYRLVQRHITYPYQNIPDKEVQWVRENRETLYNSIQKRVLKVKTLTDTEIRQLLIRPDVRNTLGLDPLPKFKPVAD